MTAAPGSSRTASAPWALARCTQAAIAVAAVADGFAATVARDRYLHPTDAPAGFASMVFVYLMTLAIVLFLVWLDRSWRNARALSPDAALPGRGWTIGIWFVPVANFFVPRGFVLAIGRASSAAWGRGTLLVNLWWAAWVAHAVVLVVGRQVDPGSVGFLVVSSGLMVAAGVLLGVVIQRVTGLQGAALGVGAAPVGETA
ncbi:DUF4328 domain-containing protein [Streptomyces sp. S6]